MGTSEPLSQPSVIIDYYGGVEHHLCSARRRSKTDHRENQPDNTSPLITQQEKELLADYIRVTTNAPPQVSNAPRTSGIIANYALIVNATS